MMKFINKTITNISVKFDTTKKTLLVNTINYLLFLTLALILVLGGVYPFNILVNILFSVTTLLMIIFIYYYGRFFIDVYVVLIVLFNLTLIISMISNYPSNISFTLSLLTMGMLPLYMYLYNCKESHSVILNLFGISYVLLNIYFFLLYKNEFLNLDFSNRLGDKIGNQNDVATYLLTGHTIFFYSILKKKYFYYPFLFINFIEMVATGSRSGLINLVIISIFMLYIAIGKKRKYIFIICCVVAFALSILILQLPQLSQLKDRFVNLFLELFSSQNLDGSTANRIKLLEESFLFFLRNPIFGGGRNFAYWYTFDGGVAHNTFVEIGAAYGVLVLIPYVAFFLLPIIYLRKEDRLFSIILISSFLIFYFTLSGYYYKPPYFFLPVLASKMDVKRYLTKSL